MKSNSNIYQDPKDLDETYLWRLGEKKEGGHCSSCLEFDGQEKTLREWIKTCVPGVPNGIKVAGEITQYPHHPYGTYCGSACNCILKKIDGMIIMPW